MVSRNSLFVRGLLPAFVLVIVLGSMAAPQAQARNPYEYTDQTEGDPGDGVLDPAPESKDSGGSGWDAPPSGDTLAWPNGFQFIPLHLPRGIPGWGIFLIVPDDWSSAASWYVFAERRDRYAP